MPASEAERARALMPFVGQYVNIVTRPVDVDGQPPRESMCFIGVLARFDAATITLAGAVRVSLENKRIVDHAADAGFPMAASPLYITAQFKSLSRVARCSAATLNLLFRDEGRTAIPGSMTPAAEQAAVGFMTNVLVRKYVCAQLADKIRPTAVGNAPSPAGEVPPTENPNEPTAQRANTDIEAAQAALEDSINAALGGAAPTSTEAVGRLRMPLALFVRDAIAPLIRVHPRRNGANSNNNGAAGAQANSESSTTDDGLAAPSPPSAAAASTSRSMAGSPGHASFSYSTAQAVPPSDSGTTVRSPPPGRGGGRLPPPAPPPPASAASTRAAAGADDRRSSHNDDHDSEDDGLNNHHPAAASSSSAVGGAGPGSSSGDAAASPDGTVVVDPSPFGTVVRQVPDHLDTLACCDVRQTIQTECGALRSFFAPRKSSPMARVHEIVNRFIKSCFLFTVVISVAFCVLGGVMIGTSISGPLTTGGLAADFAGYMWYLLIVPGVISACHGVSLSARGEDSAMPSSRFLKLWVVLEVFVVVMMFPGFIFSIMFLAGETTPRTEYRTPVSYWNHLAEISDSALCSFQESERCSGFAEPCYGRENETHVFIYRRQDCGIDCRMSLNYLRNLPTEACGHIITGTVDGVSRQTIIFFSLFTALAVARVGGLWGLRKYYTRRAIIAHQEAVLRMVSANHGGGEGGGE